jgi:AcrR family transcriptional regulator
MNILTPRDMLDTKDKTDLRIRRTKKLLLDSLISLIIERGFDAITVKDIAQRAMVNRTTFYHHYEDKMDLLERGMDEILENLQEINNKPYTEGRKALEYEPPPALVSMFQHVAANDRFYLAMLGAKGVPGFFNRLKNYSEKIIRERIEYLVAQTDKPLLVPLDVAVHYAIASYTGIITWWLENKMPYPPEDMARCYIQLNVAGLYTCLGLPM